MYQIYLCFQLHLSMISLACHLVVHSNATLLRRQSLHGLSHTQQTASKHLLLTFWYNMNGIYGNRPSVCAVTAQGSCRNTVFECRAAVQACPWRAKPIAVVQMPCAFEVRVRKPKSSVLVVSVKTQYRQTRLPRKAKKSRDEQSSTKSTVRTDCESATYFDIDLTSSS